MNTFKNIILFFKQKKTLSLIIITLVLIIIALIVSSLSSKSTTPSEKSTTLPDAINQTENKNLIINWNNLNLKNPEKAPYYRFEALISNDNAQPIALKLGFLESNKKTTTPPNLHIYQNDSYSLIISTPDNTLNLSSSTPPPSNLPPQSNDTIAQTAITLTSSIFGIKTDSLTIKQILHLKRENIYDTPTTADSSNLIRISLSQKIDDKNLLAHTESGAPFTLFLTKDLRLFALTVKDAVLSYQQQGQATLKDFSSIRSLPSSRFMPISSAQDLDTNFKLANEDNLKLDLENISLSYIKVDQYLLPVYTLQGTVKGITVDNIPLDYITPAITD